MPTGKPTIAVKMYQATYIGSNPSLKCQASLVQCRSDDEDNLKAKFADFRLGEVAFGWHPFPRSDFDIDYFSLDGKL